ncbi:MAG: hypothetical protein EHM18_03330 [Acidobacteria bacterium]|nr:MAG: hypothetical protein EHM18_03330 [Acidobacteriota bacterium]
MRALGTLFLLCAVTVGCRAQDLVPSTGSVVQRSGDESGIWLDVPFFPQQKDGCGASSLAMILGYWNSVPAADPQSIFPLLYSEKLKGIPASRMKTYLEEKGFRAFAFTGTLPDLKEHLIKGRPLIVSLGGSSLHYVVVVGLDERQKLVLLNDPAVKKLSSMNMGEFLTAWKQTNFWTLLAVPDAPR